MWRFLDRLARATPTLSDELRWRGRFVSALFVAGAAAAALPVPIHLAHGNLELVLAGVLGLVGILGWLQLWWWFRRPWLQADAFAAFATLIYGASLVVNKDLANVAWLAVIPLLALFIGGAGAGARWFVIDVVVTGLGVALVSSGAAPPPIAIVTWGDVAARFVTLLVVLPVVGFLWDRSARSIMADLQKATDEAQAANREKLRFLANISHELRTPLHGMLGMTDLLEADGLAEPSRARLEVMRESGRLLTHLIDDLLEVTRAESGRLQLHERPMRLDEVVTRACAMHRPLAEGKGLSLELLVGGEVATPVLSDEVRLTQVVHNLVGNAVKFTQKGSVRVSLHAELRDGKLFCQLEVRDTGPGIPVDQHARLFQPFSRVNEQYGVAGTGLGLSIVRAVVDKLGGGVTVDSDAGRGATFAVTLALPVAPALSARTPGGLPSNVVALPLKLRVLVVDDNLINRKVATAQLEKLGALVVSAEDGAQALERLTSEPFDLVLMDRHMPGVDGLEATRQWRALEVGRQTRLRIVGVTASVLQEDLDACRAAGMDEVLTKPLAFERLRELVTDTLIQRPRRHG
ncbi:MAG: ATP-binding protein [Myxococcaceae bacterium]|nr:ATP-binding protein [Myxococcaceae bacterium]